MRPHLREFLCAVRSDARLSRADCLRSAPSRWGDRKHSPICGHSFLEKLTSVAYADGVRASRAGSTVGSSLRREVVEETSAKYGEALERLTGSRLYVDQ
jgi:hypothetical protein